MHQKDRSKQAAGYGFALLATAFWAGNFVVARGLADSIHPFSLSFYRWFTASLFFTPLALRYVMRDWEVIKRNKFYLAITALLGVSLFNLIIYFAGRTSEAVNMSLIMLCFPVFIMLISVLFFKERIGLNRVLGILVILVGVLSIITRGQLSDLFEISFRAGDSLMLLAALIFSIHSNLIRKIPEEMHVFSLQYSTFVLGMLFLLPFHLLVASSLPATEFSWSFGGAILYIGIGSSLISFVSWNKAIERVGPVSAGMIYYLLPLFCGVAAFIILGEDLKFYHLYSGLLIVWGILISNRRGKK